MALLRPLFGLCVTKTAPRNNLTLQTDIRSYPSNFHVITNK